MPNRWSPGCGCCGCFRCDGSEVKGIAVAISGMPETAYFRWVKFNFSGVLIEAMDYEWQDFDIANGTWLFPFKQNPDVSDSSKCYVDPSLDIGTATVISRDLTSSPYATTTTTETLRVRPNGNLFLASSAPTTMILVESGSFWQCDLITEIPGGFSGNRACMAMGPLTAPGPCEVEREIIEGIPGGFLDPSCDDAPENLIGATSNASWTF